MRLVALTPRGMNPRALRGHPWILDLALGLGAMVQLTGCETEIFGVPASQDSPQSATTGTLLVRNRTVGGAFDVDGYAVVVDGGQPLEIDVNAEVSVASLPLGEHTIELRGISPNCATSGGPMRNQRLERGAATLVVFDVSCAAPPELARIRILFTSWSGRSSHIEAMNGDGTGRFTLVGADGSRDPAPSPDGSKVAFAQNDSRLRGVMLVDAEGSRTSIVAEGDYHTPDWSPDGRNLVVSGRGRFLGGPLQIVSVDGGAPRFLTEGGDDWAPRWSPDGQRLTFMRWIGDGEEVWVVNADGTGARQLSGFYGTGPVWSPDGQRIAYRPGSFPGSSLAMINADGSAPETLLQSEQYLLTSDWSRDGSLLLLEAGGTPANRRSDLYLLRIGDRALWRLTADSDVETSPRFWETAMAR